MPQLDRDVQEPRWAPDGKGIYFLYDDQGDTKLAYATLDGSVRRSPATPVPVDRATVVARHSRKGAMETSP